MSCFDGLTTVNLELTSRCNKNCWMCGRRKIDREYPEIAMKYGDMDFSLVRKISEQLPPGIIIQFHNNGESLLYPRFGDALDLFPDNIKCIDTNGKLLVEKSDEIIDNLDTLTVSVIENDPEGGEQYDIVRQFLDIKGKHKPLMVYRLLGNVKDPARWEALPGIVVTRILHNPMGSFQYTRPPTKPETGICMDMLSHMAISRTGMVSICVRFDPKGLGIIGDANTTPLIAIWNSRKRRGWLKQHVMGQRGDVPLCSTCEFWGVPTG